MRTRWKFFAALAAACAVMPAAYADEGAPTSPDAIASWEQLDREALVSAVLDNNPTLEAARQAWLAASLRAEGTGAWEQPEVSYAFAPLSVSGGVTFGQMVELSQNLPIAGRRGARAAVAAAEARVMEAGLETVRRELARAAELLFVDYALIAESIRINDEHLALLDDLLRVATSRYASGSGSQQDPLQAESEQAHLLHETVRLSSQQRVVTAQINTLLHRAPEASLPPPVRHSRGDDAGRAGAASHAEIDTRAIEQAAIDARPELREAAASIEARRAEVDLAQRDQRPDLSVMTSYESMWSDREHRWLVGGVVSVPLWRRPLRAAVAEAEAKVVQAESEREARADEVRGEVWTAAERLRESEHILEIYESRMLPIAVDRVEAALAGLRSGANDFVAVIEAQRNRREVELGFQEALADLDRNRVELARAAGDKPASNASSGLATAGPGEQP